MTPLAILAKRIAPPEEPSVPSSLFPVKLQLSIFTVTGTLYPTQIAPPIAPVVGAP